VFRRGIDLVLVRGDGGSAGVCPWLRVGFGLPFRVRLGVAAALQFGSGFPDGVPYGAGAVGPVLVVGVLGVEFFTLGS
jgi:hypothetical protein